MLVLVLAESALEPVPEQLWTHPAVRRHAERRGKAPRFLLLDRSYHHSAMKILSDDWKRGRPDIVHFALLEALGSPLNMEGMLQTYVHTLNDQVIKLNPKVRLPKNYNRFVGLIEQLFEYRNIPPQGSVLLALNQKTLKQLIDEVNATYIVAFSRKGTPQTLEEVMLRISKQQKPLVIIGGFPHGHFTETTLKLADKVVRVDPEMLETWTLTSRVIYEYERAISLPKERIKRLI